MPDDRSSKKPDGDLTTSRVLLRPSSARARGCAATVRNATVADVCLIVGWITAWREITPRVIEWLGAHSDGKIEEEVTSWITSEHGGFVLVLEPDTPVGFMNVQMLAGDSEVGRLLVDPRHAQQGFGSTLLMHVTRAISSIEWRKTTYARILRDNQNALGMIDQLPFTETKRPIGVLDSDAKFYRFKCGIRKNVFGEALLKLRTAKQLQQEEIGFLAGLRQSAIAMLESGRRLPSAETTSALCNGINLTRGEKAQLLFGLIGERLEENLKKAFEGVYKTSDGVQRSAHSHLWVISDGFLEEMNDEAVDISAESASIGYSRWYFAPPGYFQAGSGKSLIDRILTKATNKEQAKKSLRLYTAPAALCAMRYVVENPPMSLGTELADAIVSFGGNTEGDRIIVAGERAKEFVLSIVKVITRLNLETRVDGFSLDIYYS